MKIMKRKDILIILILLFVSVVAWVGSNIWHSIKSSTISEAENQNINPITATFDTKAINKLKERRKIAPSFELEEIKPTPTSLPLQILSPENVSNEATLPL